MKSQNAMNSTLVEYVNGIEVIKAFNQGSASYTHLDVYKRQLYIRFSG